MDTFFIILIVYVIIGVVVNVLMAAFGKSKEEEESERAAIREKNRQGIAAWQARRVRTYNEALERIYSSQGKADVSLALRSNDVLNTLLIWEDKKLFFYNYKYFKFADIISYELSDNQRIVAGQTVATTKTDVWSEVQRSAMVKSFGTTTGTFISGPLKQTTEIKKSTDRLYHDYNVVLTLNDFNNPTLRIKIGASQELADKVVGLINLMMANQ